VNQSADSPTNMEGENIKDNNAFMESRANNEVLDTKFAKGFVLLPYVKKQEIFGIGEEVVKEASHGRTSAKFCNYCRQKDDEEYYTRMSNGWSCPNCGAILRTRLC
jgi:hypothetical protein